MFGQWVKQYIEYHNLAWSAATAKSERSRLKAVSPLLDGNPEALWDGIKDKKPYTRLTIWTRVIHFHDWLKEHEYISTPNKYREFRRRNARLFKHCYKRRYPTITIAEARRRIDTLSNEAVKSKARAILDNGLRLSEYERRAGAEVTGKGGKCRRIFAEISGHEDVRPTTFRRHLRSVGLKPHDLRKLALNRLVELGANVFELCEFAGWSNLNTAQNYIQASQSRLEQLSEGLCQG